MLLKLRTEIDKTILMAEKTKTYADVNTDSSNMEMVELVCVFLVPYKVRLVMSIAKMAVLINIRQHTASQ
jgi:hypothetical protein